MNCLQLRKIEAMERYLREQLSEGELESFEGHILECDDCADELERVAALSSELGRMREEIEVRSGYATRAPRTLWMALAALVLVAAGLILLMRPWQQTPTDLAELAVLEPPVYREPRLRSNENGAEERFKQGMARYSEEDYAGAIPELEAAGGLAPERVDIPFFLGVSRLLTGDEREGIEDLDRVVAKGDTPFLEEALFVRAQAHLRRGDADAARVDLQTILELDGDWQGRARDQLDRMKALTRQGG